MVADDDLAYEDLWIDLPVLEHIRVDTRTMLEAQRLAMDATDCILNTRTGTNHGEYFSRFMNFRLNRIPNCDQHRPRVDYFSARQEEDPLSDPSLLDALDEIQQDDIIPSEK